MLSSPNKDFLEESISDIGFFGDKKVFKLMFEQQGLFCEKPAGSDWNFSNIKSPVKAWRHETFSLNSLSYNLLLAALFEWNSCRFLENQW